ncbi:hypothetical protein OSC00_03500 [Citrobacter freundii]|uniref:hypothetical protein n=1 Tax=Citrobacter freundii TaxID=546 RepID=UPI00287549C7|nr:hypothetical protein [Citrobacter freundii]MDS0990932.1 hypothetical protein [Citrobacter freundii]
MSDTYQAVYDAVRSRITNGDIGSAVESAMRDAQISFYFDRMACAFDEYASEQARPCVVFKPTLSQDGNAWMAVLGDIPTGVVGCGDSPAEAMYDFDKKWFKKEDENHATDEQSVTHEKREYYDASKDY